VRGGGESSSARPSIGCPQGYLLCNVNTPVTVYHIFKIGRKPPESERGEYGPGVTDPQPPVALSPVEPVGQTSRHYQTHHLSNYYFQPCISRNDRRNIRARWLLLDTLVTMLNQ
jgi:hypothetical protein